MPCTKCMNPNPIYEALAFAMIKHSFEERRVVAKWTIQAKLIVYKISKNINSNANCRRIKLRLHCVSNLQFPKLFSWEVYCMVEMIDSFDKKCFDYRINICHDLDFEWLTQLENWCDFKASLQSLCKNLKYLLEFQIWILYSILDTKIVPTFLNRKCCVSSTNHGKT